MNERKLSILSSVVLHLVIILAAFIYKYTIITETQIGQIEILEFGFNEPSKSSDTRSFTGFSTPRSNNSGRSTNILPKKVDLPKAVSESEEAVYVPKSKEIAISDLDINDRIGTSSEIKSNLSEDIIGSAEDEAVIPETEGFLASLSDRLSDGSGDSSVYILEGDISNRTLLTKTMPEYPENIQESAKVKIKFSVLKNGDITDLMVVKKADPVFENECMKVLKNWKFNAISEDIIQTGFITFIFDLE